MSTSSLACIVKRGNPPCVYSGYARALRVAHPNKCGSVNREKTRDPARRFKPPHLPSSFAGRPRVAPRKSVVSPFENRLAPGSTGASILRLVSRVANSRASYPNRKSLKRVSRLDILPSSLPSRRVASRAVARRRAPPSVPPSAPRSVLLPQPRRRGFRGGAAAGREDARGDTTRRGEKRGGYRGANDDAHVGSCVMTRFATRETRRRDATFAPADPGARRFFVAATAA